MKIDKKYFFCLYQCKYELWKKRRLRRVDYDMRLRIILQIYQLEKFVILDNIISKNSVTMHSSVNEMKCMKKKALKNKNEKRK